MEDIFKRTRAKINLSDIIHNFKALKKELSENTAVMSIVKADAYGHGAEFVAKELEELTDYFGVSSIDEAMQLRYAGIKSPILILGYTDPGSFNLLFEYNISQTVFCYEEALLLSKAAKNKSLTVHLKVDTGMSRLGFILSGSSDYEKSRGEILKALSLKNLNFEGIFTHFSESEIHDSDFTKKQFETFNNIINDLSKDGYTFKYRHCCNSAAIINYPEMHLDMVRPGLILYGLYPDRGIRDIGLKPSMELLTVVSQIKNLNSDSFIGYNRTFHTDKITKTAVVPIGYADGLSRTISNKAEMLVNGKRARILGKVCMDMAVLDITDIDNVFPGQNVVVFGEDNGSFISVEEISEISGTINYETVCRIGKRVPRIFIKDGKEVNAKSSIL